MSSENLEAAISRAARTQPGLGRAGWVPPSRRGKKTVVIRVDPMVARRLKVLAATEDSSIQRLGEEALEMLLGKYGG